MSSYDMTKKRNVMDIYFQNVQRHLWTFLRQRHCLLYKYNDKYTKFNMKLPYLDTTYTYFIQLK